jgi:hypothetical protein
MAADLAVNLWDIAGVDGLQVARSLFGKEVDYLAPFQSLETVVQGEACSVLRLCDRNFRVAYSGALNQPVDHLVADPPAPLRASVWVKQYDWLSAIVLPLGLLPVLLAQATAKAPHRLANLPNHQAVPARLNNNTPILIWRHSPQGNPSVEIHAAKADLNRLSQTVNQLTQSSQLVNNRCR